MKLRKSKIVKRVEDESLGVVEICTWVGSIKGHVQLENP
jgi:hypothetical protein